MSKLYQELRCFIVEFAEDVVTSSDSFEVQDREWSEDPFAGLEVVE